MHESFKKVETYPDISLIDLFALVYGFQSELKQFRMILHDLLYDGDIYCIKETNLYHHTKDPLEILIYTIDKSLLVNCSKCENYFALELLKYKDEDTFFCPDCLKSKLKEKVLDKISKKLDSSSFEDLEKEYKKLEEV